MYGIRLFSIIAMVVILAFGIRGATFEKRQSPVVITKTPSANAGKTTKLELFSGLDYKNPTQTMNITPNVCINIPSSLSAKMNNATPGIGFFMFCTKPNCLGTCALRSRSHWWNPNSFVNDANGPVVSVKWFA